MEGYQPGNNSNNNNNYVMLTRVTFFSLIYIKCYVYILMYIYNCRYLHQVIICTYS